MRTQTYMVQYIGAKDWYNRRWWFKVHWVGYDEPTWEPRSNLKHCSELAVFEASSTSPLRRIPASLKVHLLMANPKRTKAQLMHLRRVSADVRVKPTSNQTGLGLYAAEKLRPNTLVARFPCAMCDIAAWSRHCRRNNIPPYCAIQLGTSNTMVYDVTYCNQSKSVWTRMNHSKIRPNVRVKLVGNCVEFRTTK